MRRPKTLSRQYKSLWTIEESRTFCMDRSVQGKGEKVFNLKGETLGEDSFDLIPTKLEVNYDA